MAPEQKDRAIDRIKVLLNETVLQQEPANIAVNAPVALHQIAWQNELNGILLGLGFAEHRAIKLPITKEKRKSILSATKK